MRGSKTDGRRSGMARAALGWTLPWTLLLLAASLAGCASRPAPRPPEPERQARLRDREPKRLEPLHVAPPPEYGNKVVVAEDTEATGRF